MQSVFLNSFMRCDGEVLLKLLVANVYCVKVGGGGVMQNEQGGIKFLHNVIFNLCLRAVLLHKHLCVCTVRVVHSLCSSWQGPFYSGMFK